MKTPYRSLFIIVTAFAVPGWASAVRAESNDDAALARALQGAKATVEAGLQSSEREGQPISGKFEIEDGKLQLSVYTSKNGSYSEVVLDPVTGAIAKTEKITEGEDLSGYCAARGDGNETQPLDSKRGRDDRQHRLPYGQRCPRAEDGHPVGQVHYSRAPSEKRRRSIDGTDMGNRPLSLLFSLVLNAGLAFWPPLPTILGARREAGKMAPNRGRCTGSRCPHDLKATLDGGH